ncbi:MAG: Hpt domain-containing protein [Clostridiales bacterium]|nr:Hpt domain-containing protein [Clostridiales bacterium]
MITIEKLKTYGANTEEGLGRCFGNEELYLRLVAMVPSQAEFTKLNEAIAQGDLKAGFEAAHALKGALGNLSLTPLCDKVIEITELLRMGANTDYSGILGDIEALRASLEALCGE